ncbi:hypothetical protein GHT06_020222 [Daphnia sinensis]|uniref:Uncharacterized protein n=1 Tax=Daphnia sinensis TaxID=1820382 RepID=A0AAD5PQ28_9CRUS|nr:hypothetical protein GHT06_020222 [Daphnia sinensis]
MASSGDSDEPQDDSFSSDEETFQVGRIQQFWKGTYNEILPEVGSHPLGGNSSSEVKFFIVTTLECGEDRIQRQVHSIIPTGWISSNMEYLLYPQPRFTVGGKSPIDWGEKTFRRFQIPFESWMEYDIHAILNQTKVAIKAAKAAANGQPILKATTSNSLLFQTVIVFWEGSVGRVNDLRPGLSGLMNMLSVIGVALDIFNLSRNTANVDHRRLIEMIKNCRKYNAKNYRKKNNVPGALETDASADAPQLPNANDDSDAVILYNYMTILEKEVVNFRPPPAFAGAPDLCN